MLRSFRPELAEQTDRWARKEPGRTAVLLQKELLRRLWAPPARRRVLLIGEYPGSFSEWFAHNQHLVTVLEATPEAVAWSRQRLPPTIEVRQGSPQDLPFDDGEFDTVALIHALEFVADPQALIEEACRVARKSVLFSVYNRLSLVTCFNFLWSFWKTPELPTGRSYSPFAIKRFIKKSRLSSGSVTWRSCISLPYRTLRYLHELEQSPFCQCLPFGHIVVMRVDLNYTLHLAQDPLLTDLPSAANPAHFHVPCRQTPCKPFAPAPQIHRPANGSNPRSPMTGIAVDETVPYRSSGFRKPCLGPERGPTARA